MAQPAITQYSVTAVPPSSFDYTPAIIDPPVMGPQLVGSSLGVPAPMSIAGEQPVSGQASLSAWGQATASQPPVNHPIFWAMVLMAAGVAGLGWLAHRERGR